MGHRGPNWFFGLMVSTKSKTTVKEGDSTDEGPASNKKNRSPFMSAPLCQTHMLDKLHAIIRISAYLIAIG
jgi:hypothetical protein